MVKGPRAVLEVCGLCKAYGAAEVLHSITLSVRESEVLVIIGPSGGGKSTLLKCINLLEPVTAGSIYLNGEELTRPGVNALLVRRRVGIVFQQFNLFPHLTAAQNIMLGPCKALRLPLPTARERAETLLARVGLADKAAAYPHQLSGGQQQRVAIARALAMQPDIMLLDEITSALDPELTDEVLAVVRDLADSGTTMLAVTHEMKFAREVGDRIAFMSEGSVIEDGSPAELFGNPRHERTRKFLQRVMG